MSQLSDIESAVLADIDAALTGYTADAFFTQLQTMTEDKYPHAMLFNPETVGTRLKLRQLDETTTYALLLVRKAGQGAQMKTDVEALVAQLEADPTLGGIADDAFFTTYAVEETLETRTIGALELEVKRVS